jgi:prepilin peptidase CpaA
VAAGALAAAIDLRTREIPNWLSFGALGAGVLAHFAAGFAHGGVAAGTREGSWSIVGAFACGLVPFLFWRLGAFGGGDVKMTAAIGALLLPMQGVEAELYALIAAAIVAPARLAWEGQLFHVLGNVIQMVLNPLRPKARRRQLSPEMMTSLRFGPSILAGVTWCALLHWKG